MRAAADALPPRKKKAWFEATPGGVRATISRMAGDPRMRRDRNLRACGLPHPEAGGTGRAIQLQQAAAGVAVANTTPHKPQTNQFFHEQSATLRVTAPESQLVDFLYGLGSGNSQIRVRDLTLRPDQPRQRLDATVQLVASYQKSPPGGNPLHGARREIPSEFDRCQIRLRGIPSRCSRTPANTSATQNNGFNSQMTVKTSFFILMFACAAAMAQPAPQPATQPAAQPNLAFPTPPNREEVLQRALRAALERDTNAAARLGITNVPNKRSECWS